MRPLFAYKARVRRRGRIWEGFLYLLLFTGGHPIMAEKLKGRAQSQRVKTRECLFLACHADLAFFSPFKTCGKQLQTDFRGRQVPAPPSAFTFTSLTTVCSHLLLSLFSPLSAIRPSILALSTNQIGLTPFPSWAGTIQVPGRNWKWGDIKSNWHLLGLAAQSLRNK